MRLVILADDFTGAIDTGIQFAKQGVATGLYQEFSTLRTALQENEKEVYVVNTETRHLSAEEAYNTIYCYTDIAVEAEVDGILKKTDSGLRGNIGSELAGILNATSIKIVPFIPAYPQMNRITIGGIHYIDGIPIHQSVFGSDPFEPVKTSKIKDLIQYREMLVHNLTKQDIEKSIFPHEGILIFDAQTKEDIQEIIDSLYNRQKLFVVAGCASLGSVLAEKFYCFKEKRLQRKFPNNFLVVCGSVNDRTRKQVEFAQKHGFFRESFSIIELLEYEKTNSEVQKNKLINLKNQCEKGVPCIIDTGLCLQKDAFAYCDRESVSMVEIGSRIARELGTIVGWLVKQKIHAVIMVIGGDTLQGVIKNLSCEKLQLYDELAPGVALCGVQWDKNEQLLITKSGGFGKEELLTELREQLLKVDGGQYDKDSINKRNHSTNYYTNG